MHFQKTNRSPLPIVATQKVHHKAMPFLKVHSIETMGTQDGPGIRLVVFTQGCEFRCLYCHNPDTFDTKGGTQLPIKSVVNRMERMRNYFGDEGGITVSGGEPLLQRNKVKALFKELHQRGFHTCLDTNGRLLNHSVEELLEETDLVLLDIKHMDPLKHKALTGMTNANTLRFAAYRELSGKPMWLRHVLVPGYTDDPDHLHALGQHFQHYKQVERMEILPYHQLGVHKWETLGVSYKLKDVQPPSKESKQQAFDILSQYFDTVILK